MDAQLVLPGQMHISQASETALPNDTSSRERLERVSLLMQGGESLTRILPMPKPRGSFKGEEPLEERLRSLELECQRLRNSKSELEQENAQLKIQMARERQGVETTTEHTLLQGDISIAETEHQVLRQRMRAMLEEQRRLVDELQQEIAKAPQSNIDCVLLH